MGITFGDNLIDIGANDITPEQEREIEARQECARRGIDPDEICADGGIEAWMIVDQELREGCQFCGGDCAGANPPVINCPRETIQRPGAAAPPSRQTGPAREALAPILGAYRVGDAGFDETVAAILALTNPPAPVESADDQRDWAHLDESIRDTERCLDEIARRRAAESAETDKPAA
jgi:hypothetical protein